MMLLRVALATRAQAEVAQADDSAGRCTALTAVTDKAKEEDGRVKLTRLR